jgi:hypothetical protein
VAFSQNKYFCLVADPLQKLFHYFQRLFLSWRNEITNSACKDAPIDKHVGGIIEILELTSMFAP